MFLALISLAHAQDEPAVGPGTGDHPVITDGVYRPFVEVRPFHRPRPPHARPDFGREIAESARLALTVGREEP